MPIILAASVLAAVVLPFVSGLPAPVDTTTAHHLFSGQAAGVAAALLAATTLADGA